MSPSADDFPFNFNFMGGAQTAPRPSPVTRDSMSRPPKHHKQRAMNSQRIPAPTLCHQPPFTLHPHHHILDCGHTIMTDKITACGRNCFPDKSADEDMKCHGTPFACPIPEHPGGKPSRPPPKRLTRATAAFMHLECTISHIYGLDQASDAKRLQEKRDLAAEAALANSPSQHKQPAWLYTKRSKSPEPKKKRKKRRCRSQNPETGRNAASKRKARDPFNIMTQGFGKLNMDLAASGAETLPSSGVVPRQDTQDNPPPTTLPGLGTTMTLPMRPPTLGDSKWPARFQ